MPPAIRNRSLALVTCSMARDLELFALLADSVDRHVAEEVPHRVVVPAADLPLFRRFQTPRRTVIAQEDILPVRVWKAPSALRHLAVLKLGFRRPIYLTRHLEVVRGWMLQQLLKIELTRHAEEAAVMHVDSDVAFFRPLAAEDAFDGDRIRFFRVAGLTANPMHGPWVEAAADLLGLPHEDHPAHYIENCVLWSRDVASAMAACIEAAQDRPLHRAIFATRTMSEYYVYGVFADKLETRELLAPEPVSFCNSYWPDDESAEIDFMDLKARLQPKHCAIAMQSTNAQSIESRKALYRWAEQAAGASA